MQHSVVGFEFTGDPLLQGEFLPFHEGLTVIYGLNGAGKTRLADGMRAALTGVKSKINLSMVVRLHVLTAEDLTNDRSSFDQPTPGAGLLLAIAEKYALADDFESSASSRRHITVSKASEIIDQFIEAQFDALGAPRELSDEVAADRLLLMHPAGTAAEPSWDVWPVADPAGPRVAEAIERLERANDEVEALEWSDDGMEAFNGSPDVTVGSLGAP
ncbi:hypothetical protein E3O06_01400 [Cryobacterium glaciale]|uniref:Rad50/SbcC-type AAA domain-containing protein n=1 Tax=Cryobacterium glaciale TaxID=1259145 RepID=A0A4R8V6N9_9MICO|nr:ATP-binding protein [Cryobacterium glaciale]TFB76851.1 hypothetical protein E3O06_01400 [Cryobacterium glaciale]